MCEYDEVKALEGVNDVINNGKDIYNFLWELIKYFKECIKYHYENWEVKQ